MAIRIHGPGEFRVMPWKNGGGSTTELLIDPPGATLDGGFRWRLSMATVAASGPFSRFPGYDRTLLLLRGQGLELEHAGHGGALLPGPLAPTRFPGEWDTQGRLLGGTCLDFNVMSRRGDVDHEVTIIHLGPPAPLPEAPIVLVFCVSGTAQLDGGNGFLGAGELLRLDAGSARGLGIRSPEGDADLVVVALRPAR